MSVEDWTVVFRRSGNAFPGHVELLSARLHLPGSPAESLIEAGFDGPKEDQDNNGQLKSVELHIGDDNTRMQVRRTLGKTTRLSHVFALQRPAPFCQYSLFTRLGLSASANRRIPVA